MGRDIKHSPIMTVNIYSTLEVGQFKFDAQPMVMRYVIAVLRDVLVNDYACPAEFGYDAGDVLRMAYLSAATVDASDFSNLDPSAYESIKSAVLAEGALYKIAADVIENYKMRCAPDQPVALYFIGADIFVGFRAKGNNGQ